MRRFAIAMGLAFQVGGFIACSVLGSFFVGLWLDRRLGSTPCLIILFVMIGFALAVFGAYRTANQMSERRQGGRSRNE
jgi:F0F1-type ATP synthase assembly protein I